MILDEECDYVFSQLAQTLHMWQRDDIVEAVKEQIERLDAVPADKWIEIEEHFRPQALLPPIKRKENNSYQKSLPTFNHQLAEFMEKEPSSLEEIDRDVLSNYLYPPRERLILLLRGIEAAYPMPIVISLASLKLLNQSEIRLEAVSKAEESFTLSRSELQLQEQDAIQLHHIIEQLRQYINQGEKTA